MKSNVTLQQVADELDVSAMTVSRAVNNCSNISKKTKERVLLKARKIGYTPKQVARSLVSKKTFTIGMVIPEIMYTFFPEVAKGIEEVLFQSNYQLFLTNTNGKFSSEKTVIKTLLAKRVDGFLISSS